jgi:putative transcriptional regulator
MGEYEKADELVESNINKANKIIIILMLVTKLKEYRAKTNMKQDELAAKVVVRRETIIRLEKGQYNPSLKLAIVLAKVFDVRVEELFEFIDEL